MPSYCRNQYYIGGNSTVLNHYNVIAMHYKGDMDVINTLYIVNISKVCTV